MLTISSQFSGEGFSAPFEDVSLSSLFVSLAGLVQRCVIIQKDENGFGLTVSGDNPVFVQLVKEGTVALITAALISLAKYLVLTTY